MVIGLSCSLCGDLEKNPNIFLFFFLDWDFFSKLGKKSPTCNFHRGLGANFGPGKHRKNSLQTHCM